MLSLFGFMLLFNAVKTVIGQPNPHFVLGNTAYNLSFSTINPSLEWKRNGKSYVTLFFDESSNACLPDQQKDVYNSYCSEVGNEKEYILELLNTTSHDDAVFTGDQKICVIVEPSRIYVNVKKEDLTYQVEVVAFNTKPEPCFLIQITVQGTTKDLFVKNTTICNNTLTDYQVLHTFNSTTLETMFPKLENKTTIIVTAYIWFCLEGASSTNSTTFEYIRPTTDSSSPSSPSTPSTPTQSSLPPNTSSTASSLTTSSLTTASLTTSNLTTQSVCDNIDCDGDLLVIIIVMACLGTLIVVVVVWVCCCCPFCLCYKCCKKKRDEDIEGRDKSYQCCCCPFCVCYKRKKKNDKKSNPPVTKTTTRSSQYEMNTSNSQNYRNPRATQPLHSYQTPSGYQTPRDYQTHRDYQTPRAHESYYGHGYNNAAFNYDENERGRNMTRKTRVPQRPYTNNYY